MSDKPTDAYPDDEFSNPTGGPVGVHRGPRSFGRRALPYLVVLLVAALCGLGVFMLMSGTLGNQPSNSASSTTSSTQTTAQSSSASATESSSEEAPATKSASNTASATASASQSASPSASASTSSPAATANTSTAVTVYNGTTRSGYAATQASTLRNAGYASVTATNPNNRSTLPSVNTVWYQDAADKATAQDVASKLGISQVTQVSGLRTPVVVCLMQ